MTLVASVCSGIGGAELAFHGIAHHAFAAETDPFARAVLAHRFPDLKVHHDFTQIPASAGPVDVLVGGTPCQSFSIAGLRGGMADERGNLALEFLRLAERLRARWVLWENVPGVLSSNDGRDFGAFIGGLAELGYGWAYRSLDAQHFGLAQRRVRVFVVGYLGDWRRAAAVLFEPASLRGHPAPSREAGKTTAPTLASRASAGGGLGTDFDCDGGLIARCLNAHPNPIDGESETFVAHPLRAQAQPSHRAVAFAQNQRDEVRCMDVAGALAAEPGAKQQTYAFQQSQSGFRQHETHATLDSNNGSRRRNGVMAWSIMPQNSGKDYKAREVDVAQPVMGSGPVGGNQGGDYIQSASSVRRLTPREAERLQGFPDDFTNVTYRGKPASDGPRYRALGNAFAVPVVTWIAGRIVREDAASAQPGVLAA